MVCTLHSVQVKLLGLSLWWLLLQYYKINTQASGEDDFFLFTVLTTTVIFLPQEDYLVFFRFLTVNFNIPRKSGPYSHQPSSTETSKLNLPEKKKLIIESFWAHIRQKFLSSRLFARLFSSSLKTQELTMLHLTWPSQSRATRG